MPVEDHGGLDLSEELAEVPDGDVDALIGLMRAWVKRLGIQIDTDLWKFWLEQMEKKKIEATMDRQQYMAALYRECMRNAKPSVDNDNCVFPTAQTRLERGEI